MKTLLYRAVTAFVLVVPLLTGLTSVSPAAEMVRFESARVQVSEFQQRRAQARGEVLQPSKGDEVQAYIIKPSGSGPHPVIIYLPDCGGMAPEVTSEKFDIEHLRLSPEQGGLSETSREVFWTRRLLSWGYAVVLVDSQTPRGIKDTCADVKRSSAQVIADAYGALAYVAGQPWADPQRIGVLGFLTGDHWRGPAMGDSTSYVLGPEKFKAVVAFVYSQICGTKSRMAAPTLIFNGTSAPGQAEECPRVSAQAGAGGAPVEERVTPHLFKNFEPNSPMPDKANFSEWLKAEPQRAAAAAEQVKDFFTQHLKP